MEPVNRSEYKLTDFRPLGGGRILLRFINGTWVEVDLSDLIAKGNLFANFADDEYLAKATIQEHGYYIEWPGELTIGADSFWLRGKPLSAADAAELATKTPTRVA